MTDDEAQGLELLATAGAEITAGVTRELPGWVGREVVRILDAWGRADEPARRTALDAAPAAGEAAAGRVVAELEALFATDVAAQRSSPLAIVRSAYREPTVILETAGVPPVQRDPFDERTLPGDRYDLAPRSLGDLGDPELAPLHLAWGLAKARVLRARAGGEQP